jgi:6-phospho-beta-glucosidase
MIDPLQGIVDEKVITHYSNYVDALIQAKIKPIICLEHWELPTQLLEIGGYANRDVISAYQKYAQVVFKKFGDRVKTFFTFNEPMVIPQLCFMDGIWYPKTKNMRLGMDWAYGKVLASATAIAEYKKLNQDGEIGIIVNAAHHFPRSNSIADLQALKIADYFHWDLFIDPALRGEYSDEFNKFMSEKKLDHNFTNDELKIIKENRVDILGFNYYQPGRVKAKESKILRDDNHPSNFYDEYDWPEKIMNKDRGWEIYPETLFEIGMRLKRDYNNAKWMVCENGMGVQNEENNRDDQGMINDNYRIEFIKSHIEELLKAVEQGSNCAGYMTW